MRSYDDLFVAVVEQSFKQNDLITYHPNDFFMAVTYPLA